MKRFNKQEAKNKLHIKKVQIHLVTIQISNKRDFSMVVNMLEHT